MNNTGNDILLAVEGLTTRFFTEEGVSRAVEDVSFEVPRGRTLALVGESGCGKTVTALSILRLVPEPPGRILGGRVLLASRRADDAKGAEKGAEKGDAKGAEKGAEKGDTKGDEKGAVPAAVPGPAATAPVPAAPLDLLALPEDALRQVRGNRISMIFQEPMTSLNPVFNVGDQIAEAVLLHQKTDRAEALRRSADMLRRVGIPDPESRLREYPHQMSGGMRQRVMVAMALVCGPQLLIADEPTTALDVTIQAQILDLLRTLQADLGMSILLITHDLGVVAELAHDVAVMYAGRIVERTGATDLFDRPLHPYTVGLFRSRPTLEDRGALAYIPGTVPSPLAIPPGCAFHPRCPLSDGTRCATDRPPLEAKVAGHAAACWYSDRVAGLRQRGERLYPT